jgi:HSP20 family protein
MFALARRSPFEWMDQVERQMNSMFGRFFEPNGSSEAAWTPACEVYSRDGKIVVRCDVPGVDPGDVHVAVRGRTLTISGERKATEEIPGEAYWYRGIAYGSFERTVTLPEEVATTAVRAMYKNGTLNIEVPIAKELTAQTVPISVEQPARAA